MSIFSKVNQNFLATKKLKLLSESLENCTTFDAGILNLHFLLLLLKKFKMQKKSKKSETSYYTSGIKCATNFEASGSGEFIGTHKDHILHLVAP